jgi:hypothetical protein
MPLNATENVLIEGVNAAASLRLKGDFYPLVVKAIRH